MIRVHPIAARRMAGLSLIEMMIALIMALIVATGIITVFASTSSSNKVQQQMAALQEEGRFAIHSLRNDLANANGTYCSNSGGNAGLTASGLYLDALRSPTVYAKTAIAFIDNTVALPASTQAYSLPSSVFMRGYECTTTSCNPSGTSIAPGVPAMGTAVGSRVKGADVLTIRYLKPGAGWAVVPTGNPGTTLGAASDGTVTQINLVQRTGEPAVNTFTGTLAMLADCSNAQVFTVSGAGGAALTPNNNYASPLDISTGAAPRLFDFTNDFQTVTYYLKVVCADGSSPCAHTTGALIRRVNGQENVAGAGELVRGIERLDFRYGIIDANGNTQFLTADQVDTRNGGAIPCPPGNPTNLMLDPDSSSPPQEKGCLWRAVQTIEVHILMDGQTPLYTLTPYEMAYIYTPDSANATPIPPTAHAIQPNADQGFPNPQLRREFTTLVALRNFNP